MKRYGIGIQNMEYTKTCKTIKKKLGEDIRNHNTQKIKETIENNKSLKKTKKKLSNGKQRIITLLDKNGQEIRDQDMMLKRIEEFYGDLYHSDRGVEDLQQESTEELPDITTWEVKYALQNMKRGKAPGPDNILMDTLIEGEDIITAELAKLFTTCITQGKVPKKWKEANMIILFKKGNKRDLKNYRPISLLSNIYKLFTRVLTNRMENTLDRNQPREQAGFRSGFSTLDHLHTINQLKEKCQEYNKPLCMAFIDYEKAFDSVETQSVLNALHQQGVEREYIEVLKDIYTDCTTKVMLHKESEEIPIKKGVRQGDTISPKLFTACLESIFRSLHWENKGININEKGLTISDLPMTLFA